MLYLREKHAAVFRRITATVRQMVPDFDGFVLGPSKLNEKQILLDWTHKDRDYEFGPHQLSDGSLRFIALAILGNLELIERHGLRRAACLLFSGRPERFVSGAWIKIGFFVTDDDLRYQDEVHGSLFEQVEKTLELLHTKYLKAYISYEGVHRRETFLFPYEATREALLNAVVHDYASGIPIQISVYDDRIVLWNSGVMPENWTMEKLLGKHPSQPYNPLLANAFFRAGYIEAWGRGIEKIAEECRRMASNRHFMTSACRA